MVYKKKQLFVLPVLILVFFAEIINAGKLYVFYPTSVRPKVIEDKIKAACPGEEVTVFGRYKDFVAKIKIDPPDAVLTKTLLVEQLPGYKVTVEGIKGGKNSDAFVLLSVDTQVEVTSLDPKSMIGAIDFLGRAGMNKLSKEVFAKGVKIKRVTKLEDLLPLLSFKMAQAVLVEKRNVEFFKKKSQLNFVETQLNFEKSGIISLAVKDPGAAGSIIKAVKKMSPSFLGVDTWK